MTQCLYFELLVDKYWVLVRTLLRSELEFHSATEASAEVKTIDGYKVLNAESSVSVIAKDLCRWYVCYSYSVLTKYLTPQKY